MGKVVAVHANCCNHLAGGDFTFAAQIAKDMIIEITKRGLNNLNVFLVSPLDGIHRFERLFGKAIKGHVTIDGISVALSALENFDAIEHSVVAFIDANRCKHSDGKLIQRILSPECKFIFVGNANRPSLSNTCIQSLYRRMISEEQPGLYESFDSRDILIGSAGFGPERFGLPTMSKSTQITSTGASNQNHLLPRDYGFMYLQACHGSRVYELIAQYMKLSGQIRYILVGDLFNSQKNIYKAYKQDQTIPALASLPQIEGHQSLTNWKMRKTAAESSSDLVLSTGVNSTLEMMWDNKLPFYQDSPNNTEFVSAYLIAVKSIVTNDSGLIGAMPKLIIELTNLLFANKPLTFYQMQRTRDLLQISPVISRLKDVNETIIQQASGKIAPKLLDFLGESRKTKDEVQLAQVCTSLRKNEKDIKPKLDQALRRAAAWGRLFELKVLIKSLPESHLNKTDATYNRTALHWAVYNRHYDCARALVNAGIFFNNQDSRKQTALHIAVQHHDRPMIKMLIDAGASIDITDSSNSTPKDCTSDQGVIFFIQDCQKHSQHPALRP